MANKPRIRFRGFTEDWEQRKLGDIATFSKGNGYSKSDLAPSGDPIILYGRLYTNYETTIRNVDTFVELKDKSVISQGDEVIVPASGETVEDISRASVVKDQGVIIGGDLNVIKVNHLLDPTFLALTISNGEQQKELSKRAQGKSVVHLHNSDLQEVNLTFPLLNEQKEISTLFEKMDSIITLHQCKLKKLNLAKKSLLQKLFPRNGSQIPGVRFKGFTDAWEQRKLGDLYKRVNERNDGTLGRDKWISVAKMYFQDPDKVQSNNLDTRTYVMKKGDIAFEGHPNNEFKFGRFVLNDIGTGIISELFPIYRPITEYDLDFWKYAIQLERVMAPILAKSITSSGNSSNKLDHNHFLNKELLVPNIEEQKKIGTLLSLLSKNITLHQRKLERLQEVKKGLLQKMFV
ncbi:restriction endonuclease subunit S [Veillonella sp.]|jgi:putative specificity determinant hsdS|uniref:restriction endonuclease subunit S n=2 Tax=Veillonellaceae TaxID=31977 RepID=UPI0028FF604C|nr:restriction endonuclease subunit S [Veillonella sp.]MDU1551807.1 restriction endonuclease subunit S [Veillonella sp.]